MTQDEAIAIAQVLETADNGCSVCIRALTREFNKRNLGFVFRFIDSEYKIEIIQGEPLESDLCFEC